VGRPLPCPRQNRVQLVPEGDKPAIPGRQTHHTPGKKGLTLVNNELRLAVLTTTVPSGWVAPASSPLTISLSRSNPLATRMASSSSRDNVFSDLIAGKPHKNARPTAYTPFFGAVRVGREHAPPSIASTVSLCMATLASEALRACMSAAKLEKHNGSKGTTLILQGQAHKGKGR
jgi:hypothetical protein